MLSIDTKGLDPARHFFYCLDHLPNYPFQTRVALLDEPKNVRFEPGRVTVGGLFTDEPWVVSEVPVVDLAIWDAVPPHRLIGGLIPLLLPGLRGQIGTPLRSEPRRLVARSIAGYHEVEITRGPL
jgi:hypothetical protein